MDGRRFSHVDDDRLIRGVKMNPILYNREGFLNSHNAPLVKQKWQLIAFAVGKGEEACKSRWRDIRDHYFKIKRRLNKGNPVSTKWALFEKLRFLDSAKRKKNATPLRNTLSSKAELEVSADVDDNEDMYVPEMTFKVEDEFILPEYVTVHSPTAPDLDEHASKDSSYNRESTIHEVMKVCKQEEGEMKEEEDDVDVFMKSIAMTVKRFSPHLRALAKLKVLSVVTELEFPNQPGVLDSSQ